MYQEAVNTVTFPFNERMQRIIGYLYQEKYNGKIQRLIKYLKFRLLKAEITDIYYQQRDIGRNTI